MTDPIPLPPSSELKAAVTQGEADLKKGIGDLKAQIIPWIKRAILIWAFLMTGAAVVEFFMLKGAGNVSADSLAKEAAIQKKIADQNGELETLRKQGTKIQYIYLTNKAAQVAAEANFEKADSFRSNLSGSNWMDDAREYQRLTR